MLLHAGFLSIRTSIRAVGSDVEVSSTWYGAAAAIARLRDRARTDLAELRVHYRRHDILVLLIAFVIIVIAGRVHEHLRRRRRRRSMPTASTG